MSTEYLIPVCKKHGLPDGAFTHTLPMNVEYYSQKQPMCSFMGCWKRADQFIRWEAGL